MGICAKVCCVVGILAIMAAVALLFLATYFLYLPHQDDKDYDQASICTINKISDTVDAKYIEVSYRDKVGDPHNATITDEDCKTKIDCIKDMFTRYKVGEETKCYYNSQDYNDVRFDEPSEVLANVGIALMVLAGVAIIGFTCCVICTVLGCLPCCSG